jgi:hypothetical protein
VDRTAERRGSGLAFLGGKTAAVSRLAGEGSQDLIEEDLVTLHQHVRFRKFLKNPRLKSAHFVPFLPGSLRKDNAPTTARWLERAHQLPDQESRLDRRWNTHPRNGGRSGLAPSFETVRIPDPAFGVAFPVRAVQPVNGPRDHRRRNRRWASPWKP